MIDSSGHALGRRGVPEIAMWLGYAAVVLFMIPFHEPWRDEAQSWLIVRDLSLTDIFKQMHYEGTPALWHLLLTPLAKAGLPFEAQQWLHGALAIVGAGLFLFLSPFRRWQKFAFVVSFFMLFEYALVSRSYTITVLLMWLVAWLFPRRFERPMLFAGLVFLMMNTNSHGTSIGMALAAVLGIEAVVRRQLGGQVLIAGGILVAGAVAWYAQASPTNDHLIHHVGTGNVDAVVHMFKNALFPEELIPSTLPFAALGGLVLLAVAWSVRRHWQLLVIMAFPISTWIWLHLTQWGGGFRHWGFIVVLCMFVVWVAQTWDQPRCESADDESESSPARNQPQTTSLHLLRNAGGLAGVLLFACLLLSGLQTARTLKRDWQDPFSASRAMAEHIEQAGYSDPIAATPAPAASALLPHLPQRKFWYLESQAFETYVTWNTDYVNADRATLLTLSQNEVMQRIDDEFGDDPVLLLTIQKLHPPHDKQWTLLHAETVEHWTDKWSGILESYYLYRRTPDPSITNRNGNDPTR